MTFTATEFGFENGLGGASNSESRAEYHYVLFGLQADDRHAENRGVYFEYDDQVNGSIDSVTKIQIRDNVVEFSLKDGKAIIVKCDMADSNWSEFLNGIHSVFDPSAISNG
jgi:hypothetical protein